MKVCKGRAASFVFEGYYIEITITLERLSIMSITKTWMNDWETFIIGVGDLFCRGLDDRAVSARFAGKRVVWTGILFEKSFGPSTFGVQMDMPTVSVELPDGFRAEVNYLNLTLRGDDVLLWQDVQIGTTVKFATQISQWLGPFAPIRWWDADDKVGVIEFSTDGAIPMPE